MVSSKYSALSLTLLMTTLVLPAAFADETISDEALDARIARAKSAAPPSISGDATIVVDGKTVVEGSNGWTCMPDTFPGDNIPMCNDAIWMEMLGAMGNKQDFEPKSIGISYMLQGDEGAGVSNSDPYHPDHKNAEDYVETGPHLMIIVPRAMLKGITDDPSSGGPYVMWKDTPYAHIMVPVEDL
ncbi:hypothetical protein [Photobacterium atrarenae]|uniref:Uncharacterized protein n=1 Tax=Photobacterium atrarenae TaxID=865757 RepID=A0ABY5GIY0_9GAMM|nr:hypothetical protein [Photobacterium atrarenae]UTV29086.1 hypothetical protein NNL38_07620 [Photobacterium atrarenae]